MYIDFWGLPNDLCGSIIRQLSRCNIALSDIVIFEVDTTTFAPRDAIWGTSMYDKLTLLQLTLSYRHDSHLQAKEG